MVSVLAKHLCQLEEFLQILCKVDIMWIYSHGL